MSVSSIPSSASGNAQFEIACCSSRGERPQPSMREDL